MAQTALRLLRLFHLFHFSSHDTWQVSLSQFGAARNPLSNADPPKSGKPMDRKPNLIISLSLCQIGPQAEFDNFSVTLSDWDGPSKSTLNYSLILLECGKKVVDCVMDS